MMRNTGSARLANGFDVIVVGGGTSGSVLAARLSEDPDHRVLLMEAGGSDVDYPDDVRRPERAGRVVFRPGRRASRQLVRMRDATVPTPILRGTILGGTSAINYMAAVRGMPEDFDRWAALGCTGWAWDDVLPYFKKVETDLDFGGGEFHGSAGPMTLRRWPESEYTGIHRAFAEGLDELGVHHSDDVNDRADLPGHGSFPGTVTDDGHRRLTVSQAYLTPDVRHRPNLTIRTDSPVARILVDGDRARGVELVDRSRIEAAETILSAGAFESPKLLMLSGIGPPTALRGHGIAVQHELPGVGQHLEDHVAVRLTYRAPYRSALDGSPAKCIWISASGDPDNVDFHVLPIPVAGSRVLGEISTVLVFNLNPTTTGSVGLRSADPLARPVVDLNFLTSETDLASLRHPLARLAEWERTAAFIGWGGRRVVPRTIPQTVEGIRRLKRATATSYFHQVGTCAMGPEADPTAVVDTDCRVHGVSGLRVVDASVMPKIIRGNTYLCCVMVTERVADAIGGR